MMFGLLAFASAGQPKVGGENLPYVRYQLDNGLDVVLHEVRRVPVVAVRVVYHVGTIHDPVGKRGLAHLTEHAMFSGSQHISSSTMRLELSRAGAVRVNATTRDRDTAYLETIPASQLAIALWIESDRMGYFPWMLSESVLEQDRRIVRNETIEKRRASPYQPAFQTAWNGLFGPRHPYHRASEAELDAISVADVEAFSHAHIGPGNATLVIAGAYNDDTKRLIQRYFGGLTGGTRAPEPSVRITLAREVVRRLALPLLDGPLLVVAWPSPELFGPGDADADVAAILIERAIRARPELIALVDAQQFSQRGQSAFVIVAHGRPGADTDEILAQLDSTIEACSNGLAPEAVRRASKKRVLRMVAGLQSVEARAQRMATYVLAGKDPDWVAADIDRFAAVSVDSVQAFLREHLRTTRRSVVHAMPREKRSAAQ